MRGETMQVRMRRWAEIPTRRLGVRIEPRFHDLADQRSRLMAQAGIDQVLDVGANAGQYGARLRGHGYAGRLLSIEPQRAAYERLAARATADPLWDVRQGALGAAPGTLSLTVTDDSVSSSLLAPVTTGPGATEHGRAIGSEEVQVGTVDDLHLDDGRSRLMVKLDVQGYELEVLRGAARTLRTAAVVEAELSLRPMYEGSALLEEVIGHLRSAGFLPITLTRGYADPGSHDVFQMDGLFARR